MTPAVRPQALKVLLSRGDWTAALIEAVESGKVQLGELSLDQKQALANHPNKALAERAKKLLATGGGLPNADRQKVIDELGPLCCDAGDAAKGQVVFKAQCAKCHMHGGEGNKIGPDLTGMAVHPKAELLLNILDPSRSVEGNFRVYSRRHRRGPGAFGLVGRRDQDRPSKSSMPTTRSTPSCEKTSINLWPRPSR